MDHLSNEPPHLCEALARVLDNPCSNLFYNPRVREYHILHSPQEIPPDMVDEEDRLTGTHGEIVTVMSYCPFDGVKFPDSLNDEWFERAWALGLELGSLGSPDVPRRLRDATWWQEEGL